MAIYSSTITSGGQAQQLVPADPMRKRLYFQNTSSGDLFVEEGGTASLSTMKIAAGATLMVQATDDPTSAWSVYGATTGQSFYCRTK